VAVASTTSPIPDGNYGGNYQLERTRPTWLWNRLSNPLNQPGAFGSRWIVGAASGAAVVPNAYRLQAGNAHDTTTFENHPTFHKASLKRPARDDNGLFGAGNKPPCIIRRIWSIEASLCAVGRVRGSRQIEAENGA
jgi:hypothetical protein